MVTCRWQGRLAFLCVASWLCACRVLRGVEVVFLFLAVVLRGVLVWEPRCFASSRDLACRFAEKLDKNLDLPNKIDDRVVVRFGCYVPYISHLVSL